MYTSGYPGYLANELNATGNQIFLPNLFFKITSYITIKNKKIKDFTDIINFINTTPLAIVVDPKKQK